MDDRLSAAFAFVVALLLVASPTILFPHLGETPYYHSLERIDRSDVPADAAVLAYADLSAEAQQAVDAARTDPDGTAVVYGEGAAAPEFVYPGDYERDYIIADGDAHFRLTTSAGGGGFADLDTFVVGAMATFGLLLIPFAVAAFRNGWRLSSAVVGTGGVGLLAVVAADVPFGGARLGQFLAAVALILVLAGILGYHAFIETRHDETGTRSEN